MRRCCSSNRLPVRVPVRVPVHLSPALRALSLVGAALALAASACGPKPEPVPVLGGQPAASSSASAAVPTPLPSGLPAELPVPPMGVRGSTRGRPSADPSAKCTAAQPEPAGQRPEETLKKLASACKLAPASPVFAGALADGDGHKEWPFHAKAGHCYRVLVGREPAVQDLVVMLRDGKGDVAAIGPQSVIPADGKLCFAADDDTTVLVSVGAGRGAFAVQVVEP